MKPQAAQDHLEALRKDRSLPTRDLSLGFLKKQFKREVEKPYKQLGDLAEIWLTLLPPHLAGRSQLVGLARGVLHVEVDSAAANYEIDRLLRGGLLKQLITRHKGPALRKVQIKVGSRTDQPQADPKRLPPAQDSNQKLDPSRQMPNWKAKSKNNRGL